MLLYRIYINIQQYTLICVRIYNNIHYCPGVAKRRNLRRKSQKTQKLSYSEKTKTQKLHNHKLKKTNRKTHNITFAKLSYKDANRKTQKLTSAKLSYKRRGKLRRELKLKKTKTQKLSSKRRA